jgi:hypothetical protein
MGIVPAEGYTESDERPSVKLVRIPTAPTAVTITEEKGLQTAQIFDGRYAGGNCRSGR